MNRLQLIRPQKAEFVGLDVVRSFRFVEPTRFAGVVRPLGERDVIVVDIFADQPAGIGDFFLERRHRFGRRERCDDVWIAALQIPEIMQVAIGENDKAAILRAGVLAGLLLAIERVFLLALGFEDDEWIALLVEKQEVDVTLLRILKVVAECPDIIERHGRALLKAHIGGLAVIREHPPAGGLQQFVDLDSRLGFAHHIPAETRQDTLPPPPDNPLTPCVSGPEPL